MFAQLSPNISPMRRNPSMRSQTLLIAIIMGTATIIPTAPQIQVQNFP